MIERLRSMDCTIQFVAGILVLLFWLAATGAPVATWHHTCFCDGFQLLANRSRSMMLSFARPGSQQQHSKSGESCHQSTGLGVRGMGPGHCPLSLIYTELLSIFRRSYCKITPS